MKHRSLSMMHAYILTYPTQSIPLMFEVAKKLQWQDKMILFLLSLIQIVSSLGADDTSTVKPFSFMSTFEFEPFLETSQVLNPYVTFDSHSLLLPSSTNTIYPLMTSSKEVATISINSYILPTASSTALYSITKPVESATLHPTASDPESEEMLHTATISHILTESSLQPILSSQIIDPSFANSYTVYPSMTSSKKVAAISRSPINSYIDQLQATSSTAFNSITEPVESATSHSSANDPESEEMLPTAAISHILKESSLQPMLSSQIIDPSFANSYTVYPSMTSSKKVAAISRSPINSYIDQLQATSSTAFNSITEPVESATSHSSANDPESEEMLPTAAISHILKESSLQPMLSSQIIDPSFANSYTVYPSITSSKEVAAISRSSINSYIDQLQTTSSTAFNSITKPIESATSHSSANDPESEEMLPTAAISHILKESSLQPMLSSQIIDPSITLADSYTVYPSMTSSKEEAAISRSPTDSYLLPAITTSTIFRESEAITAYSANNLESEEMLHTTINDILTESYNATTIVSLLPITSSHGQIFNPSLTMSNIFEEPTITSSDNIISRNQPPLGSTQITIDPTSTFMLANHQTSSQFTSILAESATTDQITPHYTVSTLILPSSPYDELLEDSTSISTKLDLSSEINIFTNSLLFDELTPSSYLLPQPSNDFSSLHLLLLTTSEELMPLDLSTITPNDATSFIIVPSTDEFLSTLEATSSDDLFSGFSSSSDDLFSGFSSSSDDLFSGFFSSSDDFEPTPTLSSSIDLFSSDFLMSEYSTSFIPSPSPSISPQIISLILGPENTTANYSETVTLSCTFSSLFRLSADLLIWYHDYEEINETIDKLNITTDVDESDEYYNVTTVFTLTIEDAVLDDQGYYECAIDDEDYSDIRGIAYLTIQKPPTINATEDSLSVEEGGEAVLQVTVLDGVPPVVEEEVQWLFTSFDGVSNDVTNETCTCNMTTSNEAYTLTLYNVLRTDRGIYTLAVYHPTGIHKINIELIVNVPPCAMMANYSTDVIIVNATDSVEIRCNVESYPELEYEIEWYLIQNGTNNLQNSSKFLIEYIMEDNNETGLVFITQSQLIITDIALYDDGTYTCSAGPESACNATFNITVQSPASISSLVNDSIIYGVVSENVTIQFVLTNAGVPPIISNDTQWFFNGSESLEEDSGVIFSDDRLSLTLKNLSFTNEGNYTIIITNPAGTDSATLFLDVEGFLHATSRDIVAAENDNVTIGFKIEGDDPIYQVDDFEWYYTNLSNITQGVVTNDRLSLTNDLRNLTITSVQLKDRGNYTLEINNQRSSIVNLDVKIPPRLLHSKGKNETHNISSSIRFNCSADGVPRPKIQWIRNGIAIFSSNRFNVMNTIGNNQSIHERQTVSSFLIISDIQLQDEGNYSCKADNLFQSPASLSTDYELKVNDNRPPPFCQENSDKCGINGVCSDLPGGEYECICKIGYRGDKCQEEEPSLSSRILEIERIEVEYGSKSLTVHGAFPMSTVQNIPTRLFGNLTMICYSEGIPTPATTWYKDDQPLTYNRRFMQILEVKQSDRGYYECKVNNTFKEQIEYKESGKFLVNTTGVFAFRVRIAAEGQNNTVIVEMIRNNIINTRVGDDGIVISVEELLPQTRRRKRNAEEVTIVVTLFFEEESSESQDVARKEAKESLESTIESEGYTVINISRFDGCPRSNTYINGTELEWPELNIGDTAIISCPCGGLDLRSTGLVASRRCSGTFETGGQWVDLQDEKCIFSETTKAICQLAGKPSDEKVEQLGSLTEDVTNFEPAEVITATVVLLTAGQDAEGNFNLSRGFLNVINNIASVDVNTLRTSQEEARVTTNLMDSLQNVSERLPIESNDKPVILLEESFVVVAQGIDRGSFANNTFVANLQNTSLVDDSLELVDNRNGEFSNSTALLTLPPNLFDNLALALTNVSNLTDKLVSIAFNNETLFLRRTSIIEYRNVGSVIISVSVAGEGRINNLTNPTVDLSFQIIKKTQEEFTVSCVYWDAELDEGYGDWSSDGCTVNETEYSNDSSRVVCHCNHLTSFAIILDLTPKETPTNRPDHYSNTLSAITYIGAIISTVCLLITIITFLSVKKLRRTEHGQLLIHLSIALIGLYAIFVGSSLSINMPVLCSMTAVLLQYFFLVIFLLMAALAVDLYLKLVIVLGRKISYYVYKATIVSWILPIFITMFSFAPDHNNFHQQDYFCRPYNISFYVGTIAPFVIIYLFNSVIFFIILIRLLVRREINPREGQTKYKKIKQELIAAISLSVLLGLGWGIGIPASSQFFRDSPAVQKTFQVLFVSLTSFQGLAVFVMQCLRSLEARAIWSTWYHETLKYSLQSNSGRLTTISSDKRQTKARNIGLSTCPEVHFNGNDQMIDGVQGQQIELMLQSVSDEAFEDNGQVEDTTETIINEGYV